MREGRPLHYEKSQRYNDISVIKTIYYSLVRKFCGGFRGSFYKSSP